MGFGIGMTLVLKSVKHPWFSVFDHFDFTSMTRLKDDLYQCRWDIQNTTSRSREGTSKNRLSGILFRNVDLTSEKRRL